MEENTTVVPAASTPAADGQGTLPLGETTNALTDQATPPAGGDGKAAPPASDGTDKGEKPERASERRIKQLNARAKEAEIRAAYLQGQIDAMRGGSPPPASATPSASGVDGPPKKEDFADEADFIDARSRYIFKMEQQRVQQNNIVNETEKAHEARVAKFAESDPTIIDVIEDNTLPCNPVMSAFIKDSDKGPELIKWLDNHRDEAMQIWKMTPLKIARKMFELEQKLPKAAATKNSKVSNAPEPIKPVTPSGTPAADLSKVSMEEFYRRRNVEQFGAKK